MVHGTSERDKLIKDRHLCRLLFCVRDALQSGILKLLDKQGPPRPCHLYSRPEQCRLDVTHSRERDKLTLMSRRVAVVPFQQAM